jgi:hypothetical protein
VHPNRIQANDEALLADMEEIKADSALYIKLGTKGLWEQECIERAQTLRLGYDEIPHELCQAGEWEQVRMAVLKEYGCKDGVATNHRNQIKYFYESGPEVLWVTFFGDHLWWCFSEQRVEQLSDGTKIRHVLGEWKCTDMTRKPLSFNNLSGKLLAMQGFQGTICSVAERTYLLKKINGSEPTDVQDARKAKEAFERQLEKIIRRLHWKDFELLIDLIFRQAGWKRESALGKSLKTLDMELISPMTAERFGVQVKAKANLAAFKSYQEERFKDFKGFSRFYFAVHTPSPDLEEAAKDFNDDEVKLLLPADLARRAIEYGMASWVIDKAR